MDIVSQLQKIVSDVGQVAEDVAGLHPATSLALHAVKASLEHVVKHHSG